ncbi:unnamed protein product [Colias eurytheme]|nr:unnamed protein product [Colias eurytheme]
MEETRAPSFMLIQSLLKMTQILSVYFAASVLVALCHCVSTKLDVFEDGKSPTSSKEDEDVEVKHTIVVSTKLKNRGGLHATGDQEALFLSRGNSHKDTDSGEVPIVKAYKSVDTTAIRTPDTRLKNQTPRPFVKTSRDEADIYPNTAFSPVWRPSTFYNNVHYWSQDDFYNIARANRPDYRSINRRPNDDGVREFYCRKCRELSNGRGCVQKTNSWLRESTTQKTKVDGKLAKLN